MQPISKKYFLKHIADYENRQPFSYQNVQPSIVLFWKNSYINNSILFHVVQQLEKSYSPTISFFSADVEQESFLVADLGIRMIPSWLLLSKTQSPKIIQGVPSFPEFSKIIDLFYH